MQQCPPQCIRKHAEMRYQQGNLHIDCPSCNVMLNTDMLKHVPGINAVAEQLRKRVAEVEQLQKRPVIASACLDIDSSLLEWVKASGSKRCPVCGMIVTKQNLEHQSTQARECHKMMCRTCRTRFCFKCEAILTDTYTCGCSIDRHGFVDPATGERVEHLDTAMTAPTSVEPPLKRLRTKTGPAADKMAAERVAREEAAAAEKAATAKVAAEKAAAEKAAEKAAVEKAAQELVMSDAQQVVEVLLCITFRSDVLHNKTNVL